MKISVRAGVGGLTRALQEKKKQIGLSPQLGIGDAYRPHLQKSFFPWIGSQ